MVTRRPRLDSSAPSELAVSPLPSEDTTPPVTKTNFVGWVLCRRLSFPYRSRVLDGRSTGTHRNTAVVLRPVRRGTAPSLRGARRGGRQPDRERHEDGGRGGRHGDAGVVDHRPEREGQSGCG